MVAIPTVLSTVAGSFCSMVPGLCTQSGSCDLSSTSMPLSLDQQSALGLPTTPLSAIGLGFGVQNYTCSADNVFVSAGALAEVFDISCAVSNDPGVLSTIHTDLFNFWNSSQAGDTTIQQLIDQLPSTDGAPTIQGQHYFNSNASAPGGISPVWDFRAIPSFAGNDDAVFIGEIVGNVSDPNPTQNVSWLHLVKVSGDIADEIYRILTVSGVPPSSCVSGTTQDISVKYVSHYWIFGGSLGLGSQNC